MKRGIAFVVAVVILIAIWYFAPASVGGFTGTKAEFARANFQTTSYTPNTATTFIVDVDGDSPSYNWYTGSDNLAGITAQVVGQPQFVSLDDSDYEVVANQDGTSDGYYWEVRTMEYCMDFQSSGFGTKSATGLAFWVRLSNNYDSVWLDDSDVVGYVTAAWVYSYDVIKDDNGNGGLSADVLPSGTGSFFDLYSIEDEGIVNPPKEYGGVFDLAKLRDYQTVEVQHTVNEFRPSTPTAGTYYPAHCFVTIHLQVIVLGHWLNVVPGHWTGPAPNNSYDSLLYWMQIASGIFLQFIIPVIIVLGIILIIIVKVRSR